MRKPNRKFDAVMGDVRADAAWALALRLQQFGYAQISADCGIDMQQTAALVRSWVADGKVRRISAGQQRYVFEVLPMGEETAPVGDLFDQLWTAARKLRSFTVPDLVALVRVGGEPVHLIAEARVYVRALVTIDYVKVVKPGNSIREAIYRLVLINGAQAPRMKRIRCIIDPNVDAIIPLGEGVL